MRSITKQLLILLIISISQNVYCGSSMSISSCCIDDEDEDEDGDQDKPVEMTNTVNYTVNQQRLRWLMKMECNDNQCIEDNGWKKDLNNNNLTVNEQGDVITRGFIGNRTDICMGAKFYDSGIHAWAIDIKKNARGTHSQIGVISKNHDVLHDRNHYINLLGINKESIGWDLKNNTINYNNNNEMYPYNTTETPPDKIGLILNIAAGDLEFYVNGLYLGTPDSIKGALKGKAWTPAVNAVWGGQKIGLRYIGGMPESPPLSLQHLATLAALKVFMGDKRQLNQCIDEFNNFPTPMKRILKKFSRH